MRRAWIALLGLAACRGAAPEWSSESWEAGGASGSAGARSQVGGGANAGGIGAGLGPTAGVGSSERLGGAAGQAVEGHPDAGCGAEHVTLDEVHGGRVRPTIPIAVGPLVASSQKFLLSEAKSGSCLWGAFAADPARTGAGSGLLLVSFGEAHADGEACRPGTDGLPDDLHAGELLEVEGRLDGFVPAACEGVAPAQQLRIDAACPARRLGVAEPPRATPIEVELADQLAQGSDAALLRAWGGALVELRDVEAVQDRDDGDAVGAYGVIRLKQTELEVHSRLSYFDLTRGGPRDPTKTPRFAYPTTFRRVTGVLFLDYCTWALAPRELCADLSPPSGGCGQQADGP